MVTDWVCNNIKAVVKCKRKELVAVIKKMVVYRGEVRVGE